MRCAFAIPGDLGLPTGGYRYDRAVIAALPGHGIAITSVALPGSYPFPSPEDREIAAARLAGVEADVLMIDGLAFGAFAETELRALSRPVVALVHHPLALETGLDPTRAALLRTSETEALRHAAAVIATSRETARRLVDDFGVAGARLTEARPGVEPRPLARGSAPGAPLHLLAVGAISARKAYPVLIEALATLPGNWRLTIAGSLDLQPAAVSDLITAIARCGLEQRVHLAGAVSEESLKRLYDQADVFVFPSLYEGYGMVLTEALAHGLPVVTTTGVPAASDVAPPAMHAVPPGDSAALRDCLEALMEPGARAKAVHAARVARDGLPRWSDTAARIAGVLMSVARQSMGQGA
jgi:glycosyltransferase involved in cell wall biosynthesis